MFTYIAGHKNNVLVIKGTYSIYRNQFYFFNFIGGAGVACATENFTISLLSAPAFGSTIPPSSGRSRNASSACSRPSTGSTAVKSLHSSLSRLKPPAATCSVNPAAFTHNIVDALWFIWFIGIFEFIGGLHEAGIIPVWFLIP